MATKDFSKSFDDEPVRVLSQDDIDSLLGFDEKIFFRPTDADVYRSLIRKLLRYTDEQIEVLLKEEYERMVEEMNSIDGKTAA